MIGCKINHRSFDDPYTTYDQWTAPFDGATNPAVLENMAYDPGEKFAPSDVDLEFNNAQQYQPETPVEAPSSTEDNCE